VKVNASPFIFGAMLLSYQPAVGYTPTTIIDVGVGSSNELIPRSQQPHFWIRPSLNQGGEITLPFFCPTNYIKIDTNAEPLRMGDLTFTVFSALQSANGAATSTVSVQVFAWAENVSLVGPTCALAMQAKDEYGQGIISGPASGIARVAKQMENVPIIGKFARATNIGASAVSGIASLFGFTNVPVLADTQPYRPGAFPQLASTTISYPVEKLTLDAKNEISIDPTAIGLPTEDSLNISNLIIKDSYITKFNWTGANAIDTLLFKSNITPNMYAMSATTIDQTPLGWISRLFTFWRGDIIFTFKIISSMYHKGRLRISFDPTGTATTNLVNTADTFSSVYTQIVDIAENNEFEVRIPYMSLRSWLECSAATLSNKYATSQTPWQTSGFTNSVNRALHNGTITIRVANRLTSPLAASNIDVLVFVRAADNFEFAGPADMNILQDSANGANVQPGYFVPQSLDEFTEDVEFPIAEQSGDTIVFGDTQKPDTHMYEVYMGEKNSFIANITTEEHVFRISCNQIWWW